MGSGSLSLRNGIMAPQRGIPPYPHSDMEIYKISVNEDVGMWGMHTM
jgi:hypothetical protein